MRIGVGLSIPELSTRGGRFSPRSLFTSGVQGAWYDPSDYSSLFQDSVGTTAVTAVEQPVGLMLDKSQGLVLGPELVPATIPSVSGAGWTTNGTSITATSSTASGTITLAASTSTTKSYQVTFTASALSGSTSYMVFSSGVAALTKRISTAKNYSFILPGQGTAVLEFAPYEGTAYSVTISNISIKELPGNHALQATSASRPVLRARYNLLTYSEQFDNAVWTKSNLNTTGTPAWVNVAVAPDGTTTADKAIESATTSNHRLAFNFTTVTGTTYTFSIYVKAAERSWVYLYDDVSNGFAYFNLSNGTKGTVSPNYSATTITDAGNGWYRISGTATEAAGSAGAFLVGLSTADNTNSYAGDGTSGLFVWGADLRTGSSAGTYQRIAAATVYDTAGFLPYLALSTDDSMATGSIDFTATDKMAVVAGVTKNSDASAQIICELSATSSAGNNGSFAVISALSPSNYAFYLYGTALASRTATTYASPITNVLSVKYDISQSTVPNEVAPQINGVIPTLADAGGAGTGNFGNYPLYIGRRNNATLPFDGRIYQMIVVGKTLSASELASAESFVATKTGVTL